MGTRAISLAAGTVLDVSPERTVEVAAAAGFDGTGIWCDPATWSPARAKGIATRLADTGLIALDIEPVILGRGADSGELVIDAAAEIGARFVLIASGPASIDEVVDRVGALARHAAQVPGLTLVVEFLPIFTVASLGDAAHVVGQVGARNVRILVDSLHLARSGGQPASLAARDLSLFPYLQIADASGAAATTKDGLREEALHGRQLPGDGELPLIELVSTVPDVPLSVELRSRPLVEQYPDPVERARRVRASCEYLLHAAS